MPAKLDVDGLFQRPLAEFTAARNTLAAQLKKAGRTDEADRVRAIAKPPASAWAVNQLYWRDRPAFDRLIASGERFRQAQAAQLAGKSGNLQGALDARRQALAELTKRAAAVLAESAHAASPDTMRRITTTLEALATYGEHPDAPPAGRLIDDLDPPGFEALSMLMPLPSESRKRGGEPTRVLPFTSKGKKTAGKDPGRKPGKGKEDAKEAARRRAAERAEATKALQKAERELSTVQKTVAQAEAALKKAAARVKVAEQEKRALDARLEKVTGKFDAARLEARKVAVEAEDATQALADAEQMVDRARRALEAVSSEGTN